MEIFRWGTTHPVIPAVSASASDRKQSNNPNTTSSSTVPTFKPTMGQRQSTQPSSALGFVGLFLTNELPIANPLPSTLDELLDWTEDAFFKELAICHTVKRIDCRIKTDSKGSDLPSMSYLERAAFFRDKIRIEFVVNDATTRIVSGLDFMHYYTLLRRLADLVALETDKTATTNPVCFICYSETSNSVLPCHHRICESCEQKWVRQRLQCPFCRTKFTSRRQLVKNAWTVPEYSETDLQLDRVTLQAEMDLFWSKADDEPFNHSTLFEPIKRSIQLTRDGSDNIIIDHDAIK